MLILLNVSKEDLNTSKLSKRLGGNIGCEDRNSSWDIIGCPDGSKVASKHNIGKKPGVILHT